MHEDEEIARIVEECRGHNKHIGCPDQRSEARLLSDAQYIYSHRHGITAETLCMMLTDAMFAATNKRHL